MENAVRVIRIPSQPVLAARKLTTLSQLAQVVPAACGEVWNFVRAAKIQQPGRHVAVYWDDQINVDIGVEIPAPLTSLPGDGAIRTVMLPAGEAATITHFGPYPRLSVAHTAIHTWCKTHNRTPLRPCWEVYGHWEKAWDTNPALIRTDIFYPLQ